MRALRVVLVLVAAAAVQLLCGGAMSAGDEVAPLDRDWSAVVTVLAGDGVAEWRDGEAYRARFTDPFGVAHGCRRHRLTSPTASAAIGFEPFPSDGRVTTLAGRDARIRGWRRRRRPVRHAVGSRNRRRRDDLRRRYRQQRDSPDHARRHRDDAGRRRNRRVPGRAATRGAIQRTGGRRRRRRPAACSSPTLTTTGSASSSRTAASRTIAADAGSTRHAALRSTPPDTCTSPTPRNRIIQQIDPAWTPRSSLRIRRHSRRPIGVATAPGRRRLRHGRARGVVAIHAGRLFADRGRVDPRVSRRTGARRALQAADRGCGGRPGHV